jgi:hypothetical protein
MRRLAENIQHGESSWHGGENHQIRGGRAPERSEFTAEELPSVASTRCLEACS